MPFNVEPKASPSPVNPAAGTSARDRAIAKLTAPTPPAAAPEQMPVPNPNQVSPEDLSALSPKIASEGQISTDEGIEAAPEAPKEETKPKEEPLSTQYALLARKEKALRAKVIQQESQLKAKEAALEAREEALRQKDAEYSSKYISKDRIVQDAWAVLAEQGITYDQLTQQALNQSQQDPTVKAAIARLEAQIKAQDEAIAQSKKDYEAQQASSYQQALNQITTEAKRLVYTDPNFETIKETNSVSDVVELIEKTFKEDGVLLSVEEAAQAVEDELVEEAMKVSSLKKIQQRLMASNKTPAASPKQPDPKQPQTLKTLTNGMGSQRKLTSKERAILAFKGELKK